MRPDEVTSRTLLDRIRQNDQDAWQRTVDLYTPLVAYWCRRWGVAEADADDIVQEVFRAVAARIGDFQRDREGGGTFRGWLRTITRSKVLDAVRRKERHVGDAAGGTEAGRLLAEVADETPEPDADPGEQEQVTGLYHRALELVRGEFESRTWEAFWRAAVDGHDVADIARDLGVGPAAVRQAKSRVLRRIKEEVGDLIS